MQVVGVGSLFFWPAPVLLKQGYLVVTGVVTAYMFTFVPEWTTWTLLIAMALYDLYAVLVPGGPLKVRLLDAVAAASFSLPGRSAFRRLHIVARWKGAAEPTSAPLCSWRRTLFAGPVT